MKQNYDIPGALLSALTCITGWVVVALILVSCSKDIPEPQPADKRVQQQVKELQVWGSVKNYDYASTSKKYMPGY